MSFKGKEVLIVDDAPEDRLISRKILENTGIIVSEAESVEHALAILARKAPHLILLDLTMPGSSGLEFLERRRAMPALAAIPVIVASGARDRDTVYRAASLGASDYLIKPFEAARLVQKTRKLLRDRDFLSVKFEPQSRPKVSVSIEARVTEVTETGVRLESQIRLAPASKIILQSDLLERAGLTGSIFMTDDSPASRNPEGFYLSYVNVPGISESLKRKLLNAEAEAQEDKEG